MILLSSSPPSPWLLHLLGNLSLKSLPCRAQSRCPLPLGDHTSPTPWTQTALTAQQSPQYWWNSLLLVCVSVSFPNIGCDLLREELACCPHPPWSARSQRSLCPGSFEILPGTGLHSAPVWALWGLNTWASPWVLSVDFRGISLKSYQNQAPGIFCSPLSISRKRF